MAQGSKGKLELLAPAGDMERLRAALAYGADAVYLGGAGFGMRASASFGEDTLGQAVELAHARGAKVYLTCNTMPRSEELEDLPAFLAHAKECGVDALIVADLGVLMEARRLVPELDLHVSTQAGVVNYLSAREYYHLGAKRVVLARELSLEEIAVIREKTPPQLELEAFVHGAMCMSVSGRCLLSQYMTGRDANRGACAQPCRWSYRLVEEKRQGQYYPVEETHQGSYILNAQDLCMIEHLDKLAGAGITSFKIEGRAKSAYYTAVVTGAYRAAMDLYAQDPENYRAQDWIVQEVGKVSHRQYSTGFYFGPPAQYYQNGGYVRDWDVVAIADGWADGWISAQQKNRFSVGDTLELLQPGQQPQEMIVTALADGEGSPIQTANHAAMRVRVAFPHPVAPLSILRRRATQGAKRQG